MNHVFFTMILAFFEGLGLVLSPCILPILPIMLSGSLTGRKSRPIGIIIGFILTFTLVTLFSRSLVNLTNISSTVLRNGAYLLLILFAIIMFSERLTALFNRATAKLLLVGTSLKTANDNESGFFGGILFGGLVGMIFTPCSGPVLAAVIVQAVLQATTYASVLVVAAFALGVCIPMLLIVLLGRKIMAKTAFLQRHSLFVRRSLAILIIVSVGYLVFSSGGSLAFANQSNSDSKPYLQQGVLLPYQAPAISGITDWINSAPLTMEDLKGKVVLIDFWTYSCINCIRTLPYVIDWYQKYHDKGLVVIGVHAPEFLFEQDLNNVKNAVAKFGIHYPVALDNDFVTWQHYQNQYWPAQYLINQQGQVVYRHFGEGNDDITESNIRYLLGLNGEVQSNVVAKRAGDFATTPEIYLGYARSSYFASQDMMKRDIAMDYQYPTALPINQWALSGNWMINSDSINSVGDHASIKLHFYAGSVYAVMGVKGAPQEVEIIQPKNATIYVNGKLVAQNKIYVDRQQLYTLLEVDGQQEGVIELRATKPGLQMYTFTFGG